jgi:hypothetical protein
MIDDMSYEKMFSSAKMSQRNQNSGRNWSAHFCAKIPKFRPIFKVQKQGNNPQIRSFSNFLSLNGEKSQQTKCIKIASPYS